MLFRICLYMVSLQFNFCFMNTFGLKPSAFLGKVHSLDWKPSSVYDVRVIAGADVFKTLCPINPNTNCREPLTSAILGAINDPNKAALVSQVVQTIPALASDPRLSDEDRLDMCFDRFEIGTRAENAELYARLTPVLQRAFEVYSPSSQPESKNTIEFQGADSPASE